MLLLNAESGAVRNSLIAGWSREQGCVYQYYVLCTVCVAMPQRFGRKDHHSAVISVTSRSSTKKMRTKIGEVTGSERGAGHWIQIPHVKFSLHKELSIPSNGSCLPWLSLEETLQNHPSLHTHRGHDKERPKGEGGTETEAKKEGMEEKIQERR